MADEFDESEIVFDGRPDYPFPNKNTNSKMAVETNPRSGPMRIPWSTQKRCVEVDRDDEEGEMVPPHLIIERRVAGKMMAYSVCTGNGRTLKGRDLSVVRNSVLKMTGFLEN